jgi:hypothetical protein
MAKRNFLISFFYLQIKRGHVVLNISYSSNSLINTMPRLLSLVRFDYG